MTTCFLMLNEVSSLLIWCYVSGKVYHEKHKPGSKRVSGSEGKGNLFYIPKKKARKRAGSDEATTFEKP